MCIDKGCEKKERRDKERLGWVQVRKTPPDVYTETHSIVGEEKGGATWSALVWRGQWQTCGELSPEQGDAWEQRLSGHSSGLLKSDSAK